MNNSQGRKIEADRPDNNADPNIYEIKVRGYLDQLWSKWFEGMTLTHIENGEGEGPCSLITGPVIDQPALHGLLTKIGNLNLTLISVRRIDPGKGAIEEVEIS